MPAPARAFPQMATIEHYAVVPSDDPEPVYELTGSDEVRCLLQPQWSREYTENQDQQARSFNLYLPAGTQLGGSDRVIVGELHLEAFGEGKAWVAFDARPHHVEAVVRRVL